MSEKKEKKPLWKPYTNFHERAQILMRRYRNDEQLFDFIFGAVEMNGSLKTMIEKHATLENYLSKFK